MGGASAQGGRRPGMSAHVLSWECRAFPSSVGFSAQWSGGKGEQVHRASDFKVSKAWPVPCALEPKPAHLDRSAAWLNILGVAGALALTPLAA